MATLGKLLIGKTKALHVTERDPAKRCLDLRVFDVPAGGFKPEDIDPETGQPWDDYIATAVVDVGGQEGEVEMAMNVPDESRDLLELLEQHYGFRVLWQRWSKRKKRIVQMRRRKESP